MKRSILTVCIILIGLSGCGDPVDQMEPSCSDGECWDASQSDILKINDIPYITRVFPEKVQGYRFPTTIGRTYAVIVKVTSGEAHTYVSPEPIVNSKETNLVDHYSNDKITFVADTGEYYIIVQDIGKGSSYSVRVISYDEHLEPLDDTVFLLINDEPLAFKLIPGQLRRLMFNTIIGNDYTVKVIVTGKADTFISTIPSVDNYVYDLSDFYSNHGIKFRARETTTEYIAVVDRGLVTGSDITVEVTSP